MTDDDYVAVAIAADRTGLPARTLRYWIHNGKLPAVDGKGGKLVRLGDVHTAAHRVGRPTAADPLAGNHAALDGNGTAELPTDGSIAVPATAAALMGRMAAERERADRLELMVREQAEEIGRLRERLRLLEAPDGPQQPLSAAVAPEPTVAPEPAMRVEDGDAALPSTELACNADLWAQLAAKASAVPDALTQAFEVIERAQPEEPPRRGLLARLFRRR